MKYDIFISYRRDGGDTLAQLIYDRLTTRGYRVFLDIESLRSGKFNEKLLEVIDECKDVVVILPPNAIDRCVNEGDWLMTELSHSIKRGKNMVPVMMKGFTWPEIMPEGLEELPNFNGIQDSKDYFDAAIERLTSLLVSKPAFRRTNIKSRVEKKNTVSDIWAKRKKMIFCILALFLAASAAVAGFIFWQDRYYELEKKSIEIVLTADEETSAKEYYYDCDLLKKRVEILCQGEKYSCEAKEDKVYLKLPASVLPEDMDMPELFRVYLTRPIHLFLTNEEIYDFVIERDDIKEVVAQTGVDSCVDLEKINFRDSVEDVNPETLRCIKLVLKDSVMKKAKETFGEDLSELHLTQDCDMFKNPRMGGNFYYYDLFYNQSEDAFYLVDNIQDPQIEAITLYNFTSEPLSHSFYFNYRMPVEWERKKGTETWGEKQTEAQKISGDVAYAYYSIYGEDEMGPATYADWMRNVKTRLDSLNLPYSFGYEVGEKQKFCVKIPIENIGKALLSSIMQTYPAGIDFMNGSGCEVKHAQEVTIDNLDDGTYQITFKFDSYNADTLETGSKLASVDNPIEVYLTINNEVVSVVTVREPITNGEVTFDNMLGYGMDTITEDYKPYLDFLVHFNTPLDTGASLGNVYTPERTEWDVYEKLITSWQEELNGKVKTLYPDASVTYSFQYGSVYLNMKQEDVNASSLNQAIKDMVQIFKTGDRDYGNISIWFYEGDTILNAYSYCNIGNSLEGDGFTFSGTIADPRMADQMDEIRNTLENDPYYDRFVPEYGQEEIWEFGDEE